MGKVVSLEEIGASSVFWSHGDNVLADPTLITVPYRDSAFKAELNWFALFFEHLCVIDICLLNHPILRRLIMHAGYEQFIRGGVIVPLLRSKVANFVELHATTVADPEAFVKPVDLSYAEKLDAAKGLEIAVHSEAAVSDMPERFIGTILNREAMNAGGMGHLYDPMYEYLRQKGLIANPAGLRRSTFFFFAENLVAPRDKALAARFKQLSSAVYNQSYAESLGLRPALLSQYLDILQSLDPAGREWLGVTRQPAAADVLDRIDLVPEDVSSLSPEQILELRALGRHYFGLARHVSAAPPSDEPPLTLIDELQHALDLYLHAVKNTIALWGTGRSGHHRRLHRQSVLYKYGSAAGGIAAGIAVSAAGGALLASAGMGLLTTVGALFLTDRADAKERVDAALARQEYDRSIKVLNKETASGHALARGDRPRFSNELTR
jgi:hypothetical protein